MIHTVGFQSHISKFSDWKYW